YIAADPKYRVQLSLKEAEELKFRDYYYDSMEPENIFVGGGQFLYFTDIQSAQVLKRICEIKKGTPEGVLAREFTQHFCRLKKLDIEEIPSPAGALCRIWKNEL
ncbi:MAG: hypothetical protein Q8930_19685, partial [Bacillota bacterium]|nr:hypothetical protein [Bacillota bacterium]